MNESEKKLKLKCVFSLYIGSKLINLGYKCLAVEPNRENKKGENYIVFKFEDTPEFIEAFEDIKSYLPTK